MTMKRKKGRPKRKAEAEAGLLATVEAGDSRRNEFFAALRWHLRRQYAMTSQSL